MDNKTSIILSATDKTQAAFASAKRNLEGLKNAAGGLNTALASVGAGLSVGAFAAFVKNSIDAADNLNDLSKKTGVAVENLAGLQLVVDKSGTTMDMLSNGVGKLNKTLGEATNGNEEAKRTLKDLGITASDPMEAFYQLADAFGRFRDEGDKAVAMSRIIGKTWQELAPALAEGGAGLRAMVEEGKRLNPITREMAEQADKVNDAISRFKTEAAGMGTSIATAILPTMNEMLARWNDALRLSGQHGGFIGLVLGGINPTGDNAANLRNVRDEISAIQLQLKDAGTTQGDIAGINGDRLRARLADLERIKKSLLDIQQREALAMGAPFADYKTPKKPEQPRINLSNATSAAKAAKLDTIDPFGPARRAAEAADLKKLTDAQNQAFDDYAAGVDYQIQQDEQRAAALGSMREALIGLVDPIQKYRVELDKVDTLLEAGLITPEQATDARMYWQEQIDSAAGFGAEITKVRSLTEDLGLTFESAFEGAIVEGKALSDVLNSLAKDVTRVFLRKTVTEPLGNWASSFFAGLFPSALGNVFAGGVPVRAFAAGGVVSSPTVFPLGLMGEAGPEAIMPLKRGRDGKLGVTGGGTTINMVVHANDANSVRASMGQIKADLARAVSSARRNL